MLKRGQEDQIIFMLPPGRKSLVFVVLSSDEGRSFILSLQSLEILTCCVSSMIVVKENRKVSLSSLTGMWTNPPSPSRQAFLKTVFPNRQTRCWGPEHGFVDWFDLAQLSKYKTDRPLRG